MSVSPDQPVMHKDGSVGIVMLVHTALDRASRTLDRSKVKLLEGLMPDEELNHHLLVRVLSR